MVVVVGLIGSLWGPQQRNTITKYIIKPDGSIITNHFGIVDFSKSLKVQNLKQQHDDNLNCIICRIANCTMQEIVLGVNHWHPRAEVNMVDMIE